MGPFFGFLIRLGLLGPLLLGMADSSFLFLPFGNDLLLVMILARDDSLFPLYVPMAALGSTIGVFFLDSVCRKGGEEGAKKMMKPKRFIFLKKRMAERAGLAIAVACVAPPPFPFTAVISAAAAFAYPRIRLLAIVLVMRLVRFSLVGLAAIVWGRRVVRIAESSQFVWAMVAFTILCGVGSAISVVRWVRRSRQVGSRQAV